jgi:hypothetical protein
LLQNPSADEVFAYHVSDRAPRRLQRLLAMNGVGLPGEAEQEELNELEHLEHILVMVKAQAAEHTRRG